MPASASGAEDDGHLITFAYDAARDASELIVLKADDFDAGLVARVKLPGRVPYGFHGTWLPST